MKEEESKIKKLTKEENEILVIHLAQILKHVDIINVQFDLKRIKETLKEMWDHSSTMEAMSIIGGEKGIDKADIIKLQTEVFEKVVGLIETRKKTNEEAKKIEGRASKRNDVLKQLGL